MTSSYLAHLFGALRTNVCTCMHVIRGKFVQSEHSYRMQVTVATARWMRRGYIMQVCATRVYCVRMDRQVYMQTEKSRRLGFLYYNWRTYISRACHWYLKESINEKQKSANLIYIYIYKDPNKYFRLCGPKLFINFFIKFKIW